MKDTLGRRYLIMGLMDISNPKPEYKLTVDDWHIFVS